MKVLMQNLVTLAVALWTVAAPAQQGASSDKAVPSRGELLYDNHCTSCHSSVAHLRSNRRATTVAAVEAWVRRWSTDQRLGWSDTDVTEVTQHLVQRYYKFDSAPAKK